MPRRSKDGTFKSKFDALNEQQKAFCQYYVSCKNKKISYQLAYPGVGERSAASSAVALLKLPNIRAEVERLEDERNALVAISNDKIIKESTSAIDELIAAIRKNIFIANAKLPDPRDKNAIDKFTTKQTAEIASALRNIAVVLIGIPDAKHILMGGQAISEEINNRIKQGEYYLAEEEVDVAN